MPTRKRSSKRVGPGKAGSGKRMIHRAGGTRKDLKTWRSMDKSTRQRVKSTAKSVRKAGGSYDIKGTLKNVRRGRRAKGLRGQTGTGRRVRTA